MISTNKNKTIEKMYLFFHNYTEFQKINLTQRKWTKKNLSISYSDVILWNTPERFLILFLISSSGQVVFLYKLVFLFPFPWCFQWCVEYNFLHSPWLSLLKIWRKFKLLKLIQSTEAFHLLWRSEEIF